MEKILDILLNEQVVNDFIKWFAILGPFVGTIIGLISGYISKKLWQYAVRGLSIGSFGTIILLMWIVYNKITDTLGLDTVKNLLINLGLFVITGLILGFIYRIIFNKTSTENQVEKLS